MRRQQKLWTPDDDHLLTELKVNGLGIYEIAARMERTASANDNRWTVIRSKTDPALKPRQYRRKADV